MTERRKKTEELILKHIAMIDPDGSNTKRYQDLFADMSDDDFHVFMESIRLGEEQLYIYLPNLTKPMSMADIQKAAASLGVNWVERIWMTDTVTGQPFLTPKAYLRLQVPVRRVAQYQDHKMSVAEGDTHIDLLSGQMTKPDAAASISLVEMQTLAARGLDYTVAELIKYRGGDIKAYAHMKQEIEEMGMANITLEDTGTRARSVTTLNSYLRAMHLKSNLVTPMAKREGSQT